MRPITLLLLFLFLLISLTLVSDAAKRTCCDDENDDDNHDCDRNTACTRNKKRQKVDNGQSTVAFGRTTRTSTTGNATGARQQQQQAGGGRRAPSAQDARGGASGAGVISSTAHNQTTSAGRTADVSRSSHQSNATPLLARLDEGGAAYGTRSHAQATFPPLPDTRQGRLALLDSLSRTPTDTSSQSDAAKEKEKSSAEAEAKEQSGTQGPQSVDVDFDDALARQVSGLARKKEAKRKDGIMQQGEQSVASNQDSTMVMPNVTGAAMSFSLNTDYDITEDHLRRERVRAEQGDGDLSATQTSIDLHDDTEHFNISMLSDGFSFLFRSIEVPMDAITPTREPPRQEKHQQEREKPKETATDGRRTKPHKRTQDAPQKPPPPQCPIQRMLDTVFVNPEFAALARDIEECIGSERFAPQETRDRAQSLMNRYDAEVERERNVDREGEAALATERLMTEEATVAAAEQLQKDKALRDTQEALKKKKEIEREKAAAQGVQEINRPLLPPRDAPAPFDASTTQQNNVANATSAPIMIPARPEKTPIERIDAQIAIVLRRTTLDNVFRNIHEIRSLLRRRYQLMTPGYETSPSARIMEDGTVRGPFLITTESVSTSEIDLYRERRPHYVLTVEEIEDDNGRTRMLIRVDSVNNGISMDSKQVFPKREMLCQFPRIATALPLFTVSDHPYRLLSVDLLYLDQSMRDFLTVIVRLLGAASPTFDLIRHTARLVFDDARSMLISIQILHNLIVCGVCFQVKKLSRE